jgi:superfamily II DNA helicase RecQ
MVVERSYQESGRAGRDGDQADCILYYSYKDKKTLENMIRKSAPDPYSPSTRRKIDQLYTCVRYCEDEFRCRRTMQLEFFGEIFDGKLCKSTCDNCKAGREPDRKDMTDEAKSILTLFNEASRRKTGFGGITLLQLGELYRGSTSQSATKGFPNVKAIPGFNAGSKFKKFEADRILHAMIFEHLLQETGQDTKGGFSVDYVNLGENAQALLQGRHKLIVEFPMATKAKEVAKSKSPKKKESNSAPKKPKAKKTVSGVSANAPHSATDQSASARDSNTLDVDGGLQFSEKAGLSDGESSDEDIIVTSLPSSSSGRKNIPSVLPSDHAAVLSKKIKQLTSSWAHEEQMMGNRVFCTYLSCHSICSSYFTRLTPFLASSCSYMILV